MNVKEKARLKKMPLVYQVIVLKLLANAEKPLLSNGYPEISMRRTRKVLGVIYHIPKELHYNVIQELEQMKAIKVVYGTIEVKFKAPKKKN